VVVGDDVDVILDVELVKKDQTPRKIGFIGTY